MNHPILQKSQSGEALFCDACGDPIAILVDGSGDCINCGREYSAEEMTSPKVEIVE